MFRDGRKNTIKETLIVALVTSLAVGTIPIASSRAIGGHGGGSRTGASYTHPDMTLILWIAAIAGVIFIIGSLLKWMALKSRTDRRGAAMIGGGLGETYPEWARREFTRQRHEGVRRGAAGAYRLFAEARSAEIFRRLAEEAGWVDFEVVGDGAADPESPQAGLGIWLRCRKQPSDSIGADDARNIH